MSVMDRGVVGSLAEAEAGGFVAEAPVVGDSVVVGRWCIGLIRGANQRAGLQCSAMGDHCSRRGRGKVSIMWPSLFGLWALDATSACCW